MIFALLQFMEFSHSPFKEFIFIFHNNNRWLLLLVSLLRSFVAFDLFLCKLYVTFIRGEGVCVLVILYLLQDSLDRST